MRFGINNQNMTRLDTDIISSGAKNFVKFRINFSPEWNGYTNTAVFTRSDRTDSFYVYNVEHEKEYYVPSEAIAKEGVCFVNVIGTNGESKLATSNSCFFCIESAASGENNAESEVTASLFAQICARIEAAIAQYFSKEIVLSADENAVYWKYRDETEAKVLFTFDSINIKNEIIDSSKIDIDINDSHIIWTKGNGKWEDLIELSKLKGEKGSKGDRGPSGVYVGSGEMPDDCNIQIDPTGDATEINPESIYAMERRLKTAEMALAGQIILEEVNDSTSLIKQNPENVLPYASVDVVGGKTRKCRNLLKLKDFSRNVNGVSVSISKGVVTVDGTATLSGGRTASLSSTFVLPAGSYTFSATYELEQLEPYLNNAGTNAYITRSSVNGNTFTLVNDTSVYFGLNVISGVTYNGSFSLMLNEGTTALPYEPYFEGLRNTAVREFVNTGANLFDLSKFIASGVEQGTVAVFGDSMQISTPASGNNVRSIGTLRTLAPELVAGETYILNFDTTSKQYIHCYGTCETWGIRSPKVVTDAMLDGAVGFYADDILSTATISNITLNKGSTALPYEPYLRSTLSIPEAVQALDGYGWGVSDTLYNYVDWEKKQFVKRVGRVDMGTLNWQTSKTDAATYYFSVCEKMVSTKNSATLMSKYTQVENTPSNKSYSINWGHVGSPTVAIRDDDYTDKTTFKSAMSGVMLYYELAEPDITDISELLPPDNMLEVYEGGTVEVVTDDDYAESVPTKIRYQTKNILLNN